MSVYKDKSTKRGNRKPWIADVTMRHPDGRELRRKKRARTQAEANEAERALEVQLRKELYTPELIEKPKAPKLKDFIPDFLKWYATSKKPSTVYTREHNIQKYALPCLGEKRLDEISASTLAGFVSYVQARGECSGASVNTCVNSVRLVLKRAKALGLVDSIPEVERIKGTAPEAATITEDEFEKLLRAAPSPVWRVAVLLAGVCGLRRGEIEALRWDDINIKKRLIHVRRSLWDKREGTTKGGEARFVPMSDEVIEALQEIPGRAGRVCAGVTMNSLKDLYRKHHIPGKNWHSLRHTALTRLGNAGTPIHTLAKIAGHKKLTTTQIYLHSHEAELQAAAARLNGLPPRSGPRDGWGEETKTTSGRAERAGDLSNFMGGSGWGWLGYLLRKLDNG